MICFRTAAIYWCIKMTTTKKPLICVIQCKVLICPEQACWCLKLITSFKFKLNKQQYSELTFYYFRRSITWMWCENKQQQWQPLFLYSVSLYFCVLYSGFLYFYRSIAKQAASMATVFIDSVFLHFCSSVFCISVYIKSLFVTWQLYFACILTNCSELIHLSSTGHFCIN